MLTLEARRSGRDGGEEGAVWACGFLSYELHCVVLRGNIAFYIKLRSWRMQNLC